MPKKCSVPGTGTISSPKFPSGLNIFEYCLLISNKEKLLVSNLQFAYKAEQSTSQFTWLAKEVITHYKNNGSNVYACLLDCSKVLTK